jgi:hypothetical protein
LLDDSVEPDACNWQFKKAAGAALAKVVHLLGTRVGADGFTLVPTWVNHLYRAIRPMLVLRIALLPFVDRLIAGVLSKQVQYCIGSYAESSVPIPLPLLPTQPIFEARTEAGVDHTLPVFGRRPIYIARP